MKMIDITQYICTYRVGLSSGNFISPPITVAAWAIISKPTFITVFLAELRESRFFKSLLVKWFWFCCVSFQYFWWNLSSWMLFLYVGLQIICKEMLSLSYFFNVYVAISLSSSDKVSLLLNFPPSTYRFTYLYLQVVQFFHRAWTCFWFKPLIFLIYDHRSSVFGVHSLLLLLILISVIVRADLWLLNFRVKFL